LRGVWASRRHPQGSEGSCHGFSPIRTDQGANPPRRHGVTEKKHKKGFAVEPPPAPSLPALEGALNASGKRFAIIVSRFNAFITERLLLSAIDGLLRSGAKKKDIQLVRVPGAFEIPLAARELAETGNYDAVICVGCLLRGDTAHYDVIVNEVTRGIGQSAQETGVPHAFGVLTCESLTQAIDRAGLKMGNKGFEAALAAVEMASLKQAIRYSPSAVCKEQVPSGRNDKLQKRNGRARNGRAKKRPDSGPVRSVKPKRK
jgi:6,7-dimethyl-8-ribityllumazine synthase